MLSGDYLPVAVALFATLIAVVVTASWTDIRARRIPNWLCGLNVVLGLTFAWIVHGGWSAVGMAALHVAVALLVTIGLFALGAIGAGDAKFYASMAAWLPIKYGLVLLVAVSLSGLVLLFLFLAFRSSGRSRRGPQRATDFDKLPYGIAIGVGGIAAVMWS
ncbi:prepilin peptidase [Tsuneonella sp. YG55]|uniref:Prepilin peptidase n=1 Tax=Tsuneonella litorea TaxID=2976475 RepID=A0A9X2W3N5_9SPHN|nr:prepilin peptidase [Tsuneonella litorea]MCT2559390.1 prepilin peptidase [Tsuneonella litorea]